jgi:hypothetical protein
MVKRGIFWLAIAWLFRSILAESMAKCISGWLNSKNIGFAEFLVGPSALPFVYIGRYP